MNEPSIRKRRSKSDIEKAINNLQKIKCTYDIPIFILKSPYNSLIKVQINTHNYLNDIKWWSLISTTKIVPEYLSVLGPAKLVYKTQMSIGPYQKTFWRFIRLTNPFELVNSGKGRHSVLAIDTINRAYFKMIEIIHSFNLIDNTKPLSYAALAEGPGGFIQAVVDYRKNTCQDQNHLDNDSIIGITLKDDYQHSTKWNNVLRDKFIVNFGDPKINDGDLLNPDNILAYSKLFNDNKADLVTADGGFLVKGKKQIFKEQLHAHLFLCEIVTALSVQKLDGHFVLKIYDTFTQITIQLLTILSSVYKQVFITKPVTSRPANSEKYIVCLGFLGINKELLNKLVNTCIECWKLKNSTKNEYYLQSLWSDDNVSNVINACVEINKILLGYKIRHIRGTLDLTRKFTRLNHDYNEFKQIQAQSLIRQKKIAKIWAGIHNIPVKK